MEKTPLKFRKYTNKEDFNIARKNNEIAPGTITYVESTRELYEGPNHRYKTVKGNDTRGGGQVVVDKIWRGNRAYLPCSATNGYRIGVASTQDICLSIIDFKIHQNNPIKILKELDIDQINPYLNGNKIIDKTIWLDDALSISVELILKLPYYKYINGISIITSTILDIVVKNTDNDQMLGIDSNKLFYNNIIYHSNQMNYLCLMLSKEAYGSSGYFEMTDGKWVFHLTKNMIGNNGKRLILNGDVRYNNNKLSIIEELKKSNSLKDIISETISYLNKIHYITLKNYKLFYKSKRKHNNPSLSQSAYSRYKSRPKTYRVYSSSSPVLSNIFGEWVDNTSSSMCKKWKFLYDNENNKIKKLYKIAYIDFKIGFFVDSKQQIISQDDFCFDFRISFGEDYLYVDIK